MTIKIITIIIIIKKITAVMQLCVLNYNARISDQTFNGVGN